MPISPEVRAQIDLMVDQGDPELAMTTERMVRNGWMVYVDPEWRITPSGKKALRRKRRIERLASAKALFGGSAP